MPAGLLTRVCDADGLDAAGEAMQDAGDGCPLLLECDERGLGCYLARLPLALARCAAWPVTQCAWHRAAAANFQRPQPLRPPTPIR